MMYYIGGVTLNQRVCTVVRVPVPIAHCNHLYDFGFRPLESRVLFAIKIHRRLK